MRYSLRQSETMSELLSEDTSVKGWKPTNPGDSIMGTVWRVSQESCGWREEPQPVVWLNTLGGVVRRVWLMHTVLERKWSQKCPTKFDRVVVCYDGEGTTDDGYTFKKFTLEVERSGPPF